MGFLGGLVGSIFGGGSSSVTQTATNQTTVDVGVTLNNAVDLSGLADYFQSFGDNTQALIDKLGTDTNTILKALLDTNTQDQKIRQAQVLLTLNGQAIEEDKAATLKKYGKAALLIGGSYLAFKALVRK